MSVVVAEIKKKRSTNLKLLIFFTSCLIKFFFKDELLKFRHYLLNRNFEVHKAFLQTVWTTEVAGDLFSMSKI